MASVLAPVLAVFVITVCYSHRVQGHPTTDHDVPFSLLEDWQRIGREELRDSIGNGFENRVAKNVILFIGDGMGASTVSAARVYMVQSRHLDYQQGLLSFEKFPYTAITRTYNTDYHVADSAASATALLCGEKNRFSVVGASQHTVLGNCTSQKGNELKSIVGYAQDEGKWTGVVTNTRISHATPAAAYANSCHRDWESDGDIPEAERGLGCDDIAKQLVDGNLGKNIRVIFGGGRRKLRPSGMVDPEGNDRRAGERLDGRDLTQDWLRDKIERGYNVNNAKYIIKKEEFDALDPDSTEYVMGLFEADHMQYETDRENPAFEQWGEPSIAEMTEKAIRILRRGSEGFFLLVEGGRIDHGHHDNFVLRALVDTVALSDAVQRAIDLTEESDTLILVTADHSHSFNINGYPHIDADILGFSEQDVQKTTDGKPYTILSYTNGPSWLFHRNGTARRNMTDDLADGSLGSVEYQYPAGVPFEPGYETHSGEDVAVYARGPMAHLFKGVREQHFVAHAMMYASCVGSNQELCNIGPESPGCPSGGQVNSASVSLVVVMILLGASFVA